MSRHRDLKCSYDEVSTTTCPFGLVKRNDIGCVYSHTLSSLHPEINAIYRIGMLALGIAAVLACLYKLCVIHRHGASYIQVASFRWLTLSSLTFVARSPDPWSHERIFHPILSGLLSDICSASIYSIMILYTAFYARLALFPSTSYEIFIQCFTGLTFFLTWFVFILVRSVYLLLDPSHVFLAWHVLMQYSMAPFLLLMISSTGLYFGMHIYRRLKLIRETNERAEAIDSLRKRAENDQLALQSGEWLGPFEKKEVKMPSKNSDARLFRVLLLVEFYSLVTVSLQIYYLVSFVQDGCVRKRELMCASGCHQECTRENDSFVWEYLGVLQYGAIVIFYWCFHKTRPKVSTVDHI